MVLHNFDDSGSYQDEDEEEDESLQRMHPGNLRAQGNLLARVDHRTELDLSGRECMSSGEIGLMCVQGIYPSLLAWQTLTWPLQHSIFPTTPSQGLKAFHPL